MTSAFSDIRGLFDQANILLAGGDARAALQLAHQAWSLQPHNADLCNLIGVCAIALGDAGAAEQCWLRALALSPDALEAHYNLALYYADSRRTSDAEHHFRQTLSIAPTHDGACARMGALLASMKRNKEAEQYYRRAVTLNPSNVEARANLGLLLESRGHLEEAEQMQRAALVLKPDSAEIHSNLANLLARGERTQEAEREYCLAIALNPQSAVARSNLGVLLAYAERDADAEQAFREALRLSPDYQAARLNLAILLLAQGRFAEGWRLHEARYHTDLPKPDAPLPALPGTPRRGEPQAGKSLLVWPEQGYGDTIQFCRYLPLLKKQGAAHITLVCRPALQSLMRTLEGVDAVLRIDDVGTIAPHDYWVRPMSLPLRCGLDSSFIPADIPYLHGSPERCAAWSPRLPEGKFLVGLVWRAIAMHENDARRSLPDLSTLAPLWDINNIQLVSLQYGIAVKRDDASAKQQFDRSGR